MPNEAEIRKILRRIGKCNRRMGLRYGADPKGAQKADEALKQHERLFLRLQELGWNPPREGSNG